MKTNYFAFLIKHEDGLYLSKVTPDPQFNIVNAVAIFHSDNKNYLKTLNSKSAIAHYEQYANEQVGTVKTFDVNNVSIDNKIPRRIDEVWVKSLIQDVSYERHGSTTLCIIRTVHNCEFIGQAFVGNQEWNNDGIGRDTAKRNAIDEIFKAEGYRSKVEHSKLDLQ